MSNDFDNLGPGSIINGYRIEKLLGQSSTSKVFTVIHIKMEMPFVLKLLQLPDTASASRGLASFKQEVKLMDKVAHYNIVMITDFGLISEQSPYIVMEHVDGISLRQLLLEQTLSERQVILLAKQICAAICRAHHQRVLHQALRPENIFIKHIEWEEGEFIAQVSDFGLTTLIKESGGGFNNNFIGDIIPETLIYKSPEQLTNGEVGVGSDIFTICLIIYEMLTGIVPAVLLKDPQPLKTLRPDISEELSNIIQKGLSKDAAQRQQSIFELRWELETLEKRISYTFEKYNTNKLYSKHTGFNSTGQKIVITIFSFIILILILLMVNHQMRMH